MELKMLLRHNFKSAKTQFSGKCKENMRQILFISLMRDSQLGKEYIMWNAGWDKVKAGVKIAKRNINNHIYANNTILMSESKEELKRLLMKVKKESEKLA